MASPGQGHRFWVVAGEVVFLEPETGSLIAPITGQYVARQVVDVEAIESSVRTEVDRLAFRRTDQVGHVRQTRRVMHNVPLIAGTRIPVSVVRELHEAGYSDRQIIAEYPGLFRKTRHHSGARVRSRSG